MAQEGTRARCVSNSTAAAGDGMGCGPDVTRLLALADGRRLSRAKKGTAWNGFKISRKL